LARKNKLDFEKKTGKQVFAVCAQQTTANEYRDTPQQKSFLALTVLIISPPLSVKSDNSDTILTLISVLTNRENPYFSVGKSSLQKPKNNATICRCYEQYHCHNKH